MKAFLSDKNSWQQWLYKVQYDDSSYYNKSFDPAEYFKILQGNELLEYVGKEDGDEEVSDALYIGINDVEDFSDFCENAFKKDQVVCLLRVHMDDYRCEPVWDITEWLGFQSGDPVAFSVEKALCLNTKVTETVILSKDGEQVIVPLVSNTIDIFGDIVIFENVRDEHPLIPDDWADGIKKALDEFWEKLLKVLKIAGIVLLVLIAAPLLIWLIGLIFGFGDKLGDFTRERIKRIKERRAEKEAKKNEKKTE